MTLPLDSSVHEELKNSNLVTESQYGKASSFIGQKSLKIEIWRLRLITTYELLREGYSVFLTDVDSLWNYYVDLDDLPNNFDAIHAVAGDYPEYINSYWGFSLCGGLAFYRPTESVLNLWKSLLTHCNQKSCDDQLIINRGYLGKGVVWVNVNETRQEQCAGESPVGYHKIGILVGPPGDSNIDIISGNLRQMKIIGNLQIMVVSEQDMLRGGTVDDCKSVWIMNPHVVKSAGNQ